MVPRSTNRLLPTLTIRRVNNHLTLLTRPRIRQNVHPMKGTPNYIVRLVTKRTRVRRHTISHFGTRLLRDLSNVTRISLRRNNERTHRPNPNHLRNVKILVRQSRPTTLLTIRPRNSLTKIPHTTHHTIRVNTNQVSLRTIRTLIRRRQSVLGQNQIGKLYYFFYIRLPDLLSGLEWSPTSTTLFYPRLLPKGTTYNLPKIYNPIDLRSAVLLWRGEPLVTEISLLFFLSGYAGGDPYGPSFLLTKTKDSRQRVSRSHVETISKNSNTNLRKRF